MYTKQTCMCPAGKRTTNHKSLAGTWGIPEFMPPDGGGDF